MTDQQKPIDNLIWFLKERAKELNCLYRIEELLNKPDAEVDEVCGGIIRAIPPGWQYPELCQSQIVLNGKTYSTESFKVTPWQQTADIISQDKVVGSISVVYTREMPRADHGPFLKEETKLIHTIAERLGHFLMYQQMKHVYHEWQSAKDSLADDRKGEWRVLLDLLRQTDKALFLNISHKMLNHLCLIGVDEAKKLIQYYSPESSDASAANGENRPFPKETLDYSNDFLSDQTFQIAAEHLTDDDILSFVQQRIQEDKLSFLVRALTRNRSLSEVADAIRRYHRMTPEGVELPPGTRRGVLASLIRRFFSEHIHFVDVAKNYIDVNDFFELLQNVIFTPESHGKLGGKSAGLNLAAQIIRKSPGHSELFANVKIPKTWYITSDGLLSFMYYNNLEEIVEQKYKEIDQIRLEYPHVVQTFKNAHFPPEIVKGLSMALDDFKDCPLIVRSSSLLEDQAGAAFSGKYKSLFLANQGTKEKRLEALQDAIAEVYASTFGPDPVEYRAERGLLDFYEEMGIMIQEVVGTRVGNYYLPAFAGVAFSRNEFRWSPRIRREDGLLRLVPGLGTRAVDRLSDDYPVLAAPGQPGLRVNVTINEALRYSPKHIDVINLESNTFETVEIEDLLRKVDYDYPNVNQIVSVYENDQIRAPIGRHIDFRKDDFLVTFDGLFSRTNFMKQVQAILQILEEKLGTPVDIEFASDGNDFYLLQCRPQSHLQGTMPSPVPKDIAEDRIVFTANRYISNGRVPDITHIVYVDPKKYSELPDRSLLLQVGRAVSRLNKLLPKRQFVLMGPGRWGSRGDIKLGVSVTYSDINNTACLIEVARRKDNYVPDLSFGTHFFQDLVEADIRYLPLYPDDDGVVFNEQFLSGSRNILPEVAPEYASLADTIRLIDVPKSSNGLVLQILMNAELEEAAGILTQPKTQATPRETFVGREELQTDTAWHWRVRAAEHIAQEIDSERFGVKALYLFGSTKNATAGPKSDIDLLVHFNGTLAQRDLLETWLEGWSLCLDSINYLRTGYRIGGLLDVHIVTDDDIRRKTSYAAKIDAITDAARPLPIPKRSAPSDK
jgi:pyruvate,water dikinase